MLAISAVELAHSDVRVLAFTFSIKWSKCSDLHSDLLMPMAAVAVGSLWKMAFTLRGIFVWGG